MDKKNLEIIWKGIKERGFPLSVAQRDVRFFIDNFWTYEKLRKKVDVSYEGEKVAKMSLAKAILNMLLISTLDENNFKFKDVRNYIFKGSGNIESQNEYINRIKDECFMRGLDFFETAHIVGNLKEDFVQFSWVIEEKNITDISILDIFELCDADETLKDWILNGPIKDDERLSLKEVEDRKKECLKYVDRVIKEKNIQPLKSLLAAGTGLRLAQFVDCLFMIGTRPDGDTIIPHITRESWLRGINNRETFYRESQISRDATIITKLEVRDPGSFQKFVSYLNEPNFLNPNPDYMCDSIHYVEYAITSQEVLNKIHDRYMILNDNPQDVVRVDKSMTELIGRKVKLRSPKTCNSKHGICRFCVGEHTYIDNVRGPLDSRNNFGVALVKWYISPEGQNYLSAKHNMVSNLIDVVFTVDKHVELKVHDVDIVYCTNDKNAKFEVPEEFLNEDETFSSFIVHSKGVAYTVDVNTICFQDEKGIHVVYKNKRKSKVYLDIKDIFNKPNRFEDPIKSLNDILDTPYVVGETLMNRMLFMVDENKNKVRPDYSKPFDDKDLVWLNLTSSIIKNDGVVNKLCYGEFNNILVDPENYKDTNPMPYDVLFKDRSNFKKVVADYREKYNDKIK